MRTLITLFSLTLVSSALVAAEVHPEVQAALNWQLTPSTCHEITAGLSSDATTERRNIEKAMEDRAECVQQYKQDLLADFERLKSSASHGLTQDQANTILGHMKMIQKAIEAPMAAAMEAATKQSVPTDSRDHYDRAHGR